MVYPFQMCPKEKQKGQLGPFAKKDRKGKYKQGKEDDKTSSNRTTPLGRESEESKERKTPIASMNVHIYMCRGI